MKEQVADFEPQPVITRDKCYNADRYNYFLSDYRSKAFMLMVLKNPIVAIKSLTATTLRNIVGDLELDETLTSRETNQC